MKSLFTASVLEDAALEWFAGLRTRCERPDLRSRPRGPLHGQAVPQQSCSRGGRRVAHSEIRLEPDTTAAGYEPIVLVDTPEEALRVIAELFEELDGRGDPR